MIFLNQPKQFRDLTDKDYMELAKILEKMNGRPYSLEEARRFGDDLITVMHTLANGRNIIAKRPEKLDENAKQIEQYLNF